MKKHTLIALAALALLVPFSVSGAVKDKDATIRAVLERVEALEARIEALENPKLEVLKAPEVPCATPWKLPKGVNVRPYCPTR